MQSGGHSRWFPGATADLKNGGVYANRVRPEPRPTAAATLSRVLPASGCGNISTPCFCALAASDMRHLARSRSTDSNSSASAIFCEKVFSRCRLNSPLPHGLFLWAPGIPDAVAGLVHGVVSRIAFYGVLNVPIRSWKVNRNSWTWPCFRLSARTWTGFQIPCRVRKTPSALGYPCRPAGFTWGEGYAQYVPPGASTGSFPWRSSLRARLPWGCFANHPGDISSHQT